MYKTPKFYGPQLLYQMVKKSIFISLLERYIRYL